MTAWAHADVLDNGPAYIKANCNAVVLISAYTPGDTYTAVYTTNKVAEAAMAGTDFTHGSSGSDRTLTAVTSGKSGTAGATTTTEDLRLAFVDTVGSKVLWVTEETTNQAITSGNTVNFPATGPVYTVQQPTSV